MDIRTPMLSKDGRRISGYDMESGTSKIWEINGDDSCKEVMDFKFPIGKADFSYDNKKLATHVDVQDNMNTSWVGFHLPQASNFDVVIYDFETKSFSRATQNIRKTSFYPYFTKNNNVTFESIEYDGKTYFETFDPLNAQLVNLNPPGCEDKLTHNLRSLIGALWYAICSAEKIEPTRKTAEFLALSLDPEKCQTLVKKYFKDKRDEIVENGFFTNSYLVTEEHLLAACPKN